MGEHGSIGGYLQQVTFVTESAEDEVWYARADAMITDVIEASFDGSNVHAPQCAKNVNHGCIRQRNLELDLGKCGVSSQKQVLEYFDVENRHPLVMSPRTKAQE
jgi:hypothetical protein